MSGEGRGRGSPARSLLTRLSAELFRKIDGSSVVFFRIAFGLVMAYEAIDELFFGKLEYHFVTPVLHFTWPGFEWVTPMPKAWMQALFVVTAASAIAIALGFWHRIAATVYLLCTVYTFLIDSALYNNHLYLFRLIAFLLIFVPANRRFALDSARRGSAESTVPAWSVWLLRFQIGLVYFYGGIAKINYDWLIRAEPMTLWFANGAMNFPVEMRFFGRDWAGPVFSWGGLLFDLLVVPALLYRKTRPWAFLAACAFHLTNARMLDIGPFPWVMIFLTTIFFSPDWAARVGVVPRVRSPKKTKKRLAEKAPSTPAPDAPLGMRRQRLALAALALWVTVHCLLPFRHHLYPGDVAWTDEGHFFAWRMMLRDKKGEVRFTMYDPVARKVSIYEGLEAVLTDKQRRRLIRRPLMIRQFARYLGEALEAQGNRDFEVRVLSSISLNGLPPAPNVDPEINLAASDEELAGVQWILPHPREHESPRRRRMGASAAGEGKP